MDETDKSGAGGKGHRRGSPWTGVLFVAAFLAAGQLLASLATAIARRDEPVEPPAGAVAGDVETPAPASSVRTAEPADEVAGLGVIKIRDAYPAACLRRVSRPRVGKVAASHAGEVTIASRRRLRSIAARPPLQWSPSGRYLATDAARLWTSTGRSLGPSRGASLFAWSPVADCLVTVSDRGRALTASRPRGSESEMFALEGERILDLAFSGNGRKLAFTTRSASGSALWVADLARGRATAEVEEEDQIHLRDWTLRGPAYSVTTGASAEDGGIAVRLPGRRAPLAGGAPVVTDPGSHARCGAVDVFIEGSGSATDSAGRLLAVPATGGPRHVTPQGLTVHSFACSPDGRFVAASLIQRGRAGSGPRLAVFPVAGGRGRYLTGPGGATEEAPLWGPRGSGLLFLRRSPGAGVATVWALREQGDTRSTPVEVTLSTPAPLDWSADRPSGRPPGR